MLFQSSECILSILTSHIICSLKFSSKFILTDESGKANMTDRADKADTSDRARIKKKLKESEKLKAEKASSFKKKL